MATSGPQYTSRTMDTLGEGGGERMVAASAERNKDPILEQLARLFPPAEGGDPGSDPSSEAGGDLVLEVSSGTGQHVAHFARALPHLRFLPTELTDETFPSIASWCAGLPNALPPRVLDCASGAAWDALGLEPESCRGCYVANLCHISPFGVTAGLVAGAAKVLRPGGLLCVYGPFTVAGAHSSQGNIDFDRSLRAKDPAWGYRDVGDLEALAEDAGMALREKIDMPANNLLLVFARP